MTREGATVTLDAMGCQRDIATKIRSKGADSDAIDWLRERHPGRQGLASIGRIVSAREQGGKERLIKAEA